MVRQWSPDWRDRLKGANCPACRDTSADEQEHGIRFYRAESADAYLQLLPIRPGHTTVVWRGRHVAEPTELSAEEAMSYWREVLRVGSALERHYQPAKVNYLTLGNAMPHLHTHIVPRPWEDPEAAGPFTFHLDVPEIPREKLLAEADALRQILS